MRLLDTGPPLCRVAVTNSTERNYNVILKAVLNQDYLLSGSIYWPFLFLNIFLNYYTLFWVT
jgi:hypothetical protein